MAEQGEPVRTLLHDLGRRERVLLLLRAALQGSLALSLLGLVVILAALGGLPVALARVLLSLLATAVLIAALGWPLMPAWRASLDPRRHARRVEGLYPTLRGRLVMLAERPTGPRAGESPALFALAMGKAVVSLQGLLPVTVYPSRVLHPLATANLAAVAGLLLTAWLASMGPFQALQRLVGGQVASAQAASAIEGTPGVPAAVLGDIVLRYSYPSYTGLESVVVPNSTGEVHAPLGTLVEVRARTEASFESAVLEVQAGEDPVVRSSAGLLDGRDLEASFEVVGEGHWAFRLWAGEREQVSAQHAITPEPDLPPEVLLEAPAPGIEVAWDQPVPLVWTARDDYGVARVEAAVSRGKERKVQGIVEPLDPVTRLQQELSVSPADLGLHPGDEAELRIVAWDNDGISGSKAGESRPVHLVVLGPKGEAARNARLVQELRDLLLVVLADFLEKDPAWAQGAGANAAVTRGELSRWGAVLSTRIEPLDELTRSWWEGFDPESFVGTVVTTLRGDYGALVSFLQAVGQPGGEAGTSVEDLVTLAHLRDDTIDSLEQGILTLDQVVRMLAFNKLSEMAQQVAQEAEDLASLQGADAAEMLARLDRLERQLERLARAAQEAGAGGLQETINSEVMDAQNLVAEIRRAIAEGRMEDAEALLERLAEELKTFSEQMQQMQEDQQQSDEEAAAALRELKEELARLEGEQRQLVQESQALQQAAGEGGDNNHWDELARRAAALADNLEALAARLEAEPARVGLEASRAQSAAQEARNLQAALSARDPARSLQQAQQLEWRAELLQETVRRTLERLAALEMPRPDGAVLATEVRGAHEEATSIREALEAALEDLGRVNPEQLQAARSQARRQRELEQRAQQAAQTASQLAPQLPMQAPGLEDGLQGATEEMGRADDALRQGQVPAAESAQQLAADHLAEAQRALERAMRDASDMAGFSQSSGQRRSADGSSSGQRGSESQRARNERTEIPAPEEFSTPEAYRQALLDGMEGAVPREYEALKRRYYEELVRQ